jgi:hypothetical protein
VSRVSVCITAGRLSISTSEITKAFVKGSTLLLPEKNRFRSIARMFSEFTLVVSSCSVQDNAIQHVCGIRVCVCVCVISVSFVSVGTCLINVNNMAVITV